MKLDPYLKPNTKTKKWIKNLNLRAKTIKPLEENRVHDFEFSKRFLHMTLKA